MTGTEFSVVPDQVPSALSHVPCCTEALRGAGMAWHGLAWPGSYGPCFIALLRLFRLSQNQTGLLSAARLADPSEAFRALIGARINCNVREANKLI